MSFLPVRKAAFSNGIIIESKLLQKESIAVHVKTFPLPDVFTIFWASNTKSYYLSGKQRIRIYTFLYFYTNHKCRFHKHYNCTDIYVISLLYMEHTTQYHHCISCPNTEFHKDTPVSHLRVLRVVLEKWSTQLKQLYGHKWHESLVVRFITIQEREPLKKVQNKKLQMFKARFESVHVYNQLEHL